MIKMCVGFRFTPCKHVVLIHKVKPPWQADFLNGVGGKFWPGETAHIAMVREFKEETGFRTGPDDWEVFCVLSGKVAKPGEYRLFCCRSFGEVELQQPEEEKPGLHDVFEISHLKVVPNLRWLIPMALDKDVHTPVYITDIGPN